MTPQEIRAAALHVAVEAAKLRNWSPPPNTMFWAGPYPSDIIEGAKVFEGYITGAGDTKQ